MANAGFTRPEATRTAARRLIAERVRNGVLGPGDRLSPAMLATELGISATPLREALIELVRDGYLDNRSQYGFAVRPLSVKEIGELYPTIASLESLAIRQQTFDSEKLAELDRINARFAKARKVDDVSALDALWHSTLVAGSDNDTLHEMLSILKSRAQRYEDAYIRYSGAMRGSAKQHTAITDALRKGAVETAARVLEENWISGIRFLVPWLESQHPEKER